MLNNLKELVAINSYSKKEEIIEYLNLKFSPYCKEVKIIKNIENNNKSIVLGLNTNLKDIEPLILSGHIDTVSPSYDKYRTNPLELTLMGDKAYGLGSIDMKSFTAVILDKIDLIKDIKCPIIIALTTDEETDLLCIENVIKFFKEQNIKPKFTIVGEPTKSQFNNQANGCYEFLIEVFGKSCHSSILQDGINAINVMARIVTFIEQAQREYNITSNCGVINGGDVVNRVPDLCSLKFDVRSVNKSEVDLFILLLNEKMEELKKSYNCEIVMKKTLEIPPLETKRDAVIKELADFLNVSVDKFNGGCEAGYYQSVSGDAIIFGVGDMSLAHKPNEYVSVKEYQQYGDMLIKLIDKIQQKYYT